MANHPKIDFKALDKIEAATVVILVGDDLKPPKEALGVLGKGLADLVKKAAAAEKFLGKSLATLSIPAPAGIAIERLVVIGLGTDKDAAKRDWTRLGGTCAAAVKAGTAVVIAGERASAEDIAAMAVGMRLNAYCFDRYKTKKKDNDSTLTKVTFALSDPGPAKKAYKQAEAVADGVILARDLVNEPANVLYPEEFAKRTGALSKLGIAVEVLDEKDLGKLGMRSLLAVGQGSPRESQVVVMRWQGGEENDAPVAFIGKGVCFDTGGISIKPAQSMEDMKGDMGGAACVTGLMMALAGRKAKVNAVGVIGLVENMPDGKAQRPGDIVTAMSGATIEVINTDAEGRLVLADILWYAQERFKPRFMVDLATLTGAIMVALGSAYTGMFANDDTLAAQLTSVGEATGEKVWRMPLATEYDKMIESKFADIMNSAGRMGGSCTAAAFLKHFVKDGTPWVHLDIAGTAMNSPKTEISQGWASGWGVRLLDKLVRDHYEG